MSYQIKEKQNYIGTPSAHLIPVNYDISHHTV